MKLDVIFQAQVKHHRNKTGIDFDFGRHKDLPTLKSDIHLDLRASFITFSRVSYLFELFEVSNCIYTYAWWNFGGQNFDFLYINDFGL